MRYVNCIAVVCVLFFFIPIAALAGSLNDPGAPDNVASAMYTLEDIYNRLDAGTAGAKRTSAFTEPSSGPDSTGRTTDEIMGKAPLVDNTNGAGVADVASGKTFWGLNSGEWGLNTGTGTIATDPAPVAKTGQTTSYATGDDGDLEKGIAWPLPPSSGPGRFTDNTDGTVTDNLTGLIWLKDADCLYYRTWADAFVYVNNLNSGTEYTCDSYTAGTFDDWRLPNVKELQSLTDFAFFSPALSDDAGTGQWSGSAGSSFTGVQSTGYWSGTTSVFDTAQAWYVYMTDGLVSWTWKTGTYYIWPVRGGQ